MKKNMKSLIASVLAVVMIFALAACGRSNSYAKSESSPSYAPAAGLSYDAYIEEPMMADEASYGGFSAQSNSAREDSPAEAPSAGDIAVDKIPSSAFGKPAKALLKGLEYLRIALAGDDEAKHPRGIEGILRYRRRRSPARHDQALALQVERGPAYRWP